MSIASAERNVAIVLAAIGVDQNDDLTAQQAQSDPAPLTATIRVRGGNQ